MNLQRRVRPKKEKNKARVDGGESMHIKSTTRTRTIKVAVVVEKVAEQYKVKYERANLTETEGIRQIIVMDKVDVCEAKRA